MPQTSGKSQASAEFRLYRSMRAKAFKIPWRDFAAERDRLIHWRTFGLWARAIADAEQAIPRILRERLDRECPGCLANRDNNTYTTLWADISAWVDRHVFANADTRLDALHYYAGRDPRTEQAWAHWTRTAEAWRIKKPTKYPSFEVWNKQALASPRENGQPIIDADIVDAFIEWEAFAFWVRVATTAARHLPDAVAAALEKRCPGFLAQFRAQATISPKTTMQFWTELLTWIETNHFRKAESAMGIQSVRDAAHRHLRAERISGYRTECEYAWRRKPPDPYPTFEHWLREADAFVAGVRRPPRRVISPRP